MRVIPKILEENPIIAAPRTDEAFYKALKSPVEIIIILNGNIETVEEYITKAHTSGKKILIHIDLCAGLGKDSYALSHLKKIGADGIASTKSQLIKSAKELGLITLQRFFIVDSQSLLTAYENIRQTKPDMIEIMPGIMPEIIREIKTKIALPVIAGGLISKREDIIEALSSGASGISTGKENLWYE